jgi:hypothetical protein
MDRNYRLSAFLVLAFSAALVAAAAGMAAVTAMPVFQSAQVANPVTGEAKNTVSLPANAAATAPNIYYLGASVDNGRIVEGYAIFQYEGFAKPTGCNNDGRCQGWEDPSCGDCQGGGNGGETSDCYGFLSRGAKWKTLEPYIVDPSNNESLSDSFVRSNLAGDIAKWEAAASYDILGSEINGVVDGADTVDPDGKNEVYFGDISQPGAIGVTIVWGIFRGPPDLRELVEWDQVYDDADFDWSSSGEPGKMDFEAIATHELGHSVGLDDLYNDECSEMTMYGYADNGETKKRTLEDGDIAGVSSLYA